MVSENYLSREAYQNMSQDEVPQWVISHSVTCALCGDFADERETISLWEDAHEGSSSDIDWSELPEGEAHQSCFENREEYGY